MNNFIGDAKLQELPNLKYLIGRYLGLPNYFSLISHHNNLM